LTISYLIKKLITGFIENIREIYNSLILEGESINTIKFVIIVDDIASKLRDILVLKDFLTSRGRSVLFIAAARSNEIENKMFRIDSDLEFEIPESLNDHETLNISKHFINLGFSYFTLPRLQDIIKKEYDKSFFATIYSIVHPSRKPLDEIIKDQYTSLSEQAKLAFEYICCFSQFNIPINIELLVRSLEISYTTFIEDILKSETQKIIFQEEDVNGNIFLRTHHAIIAKKTIDFFLKDSKLLLDKYIKIFTNANFSLDIEREICEKIIIDHLKGRESKYRTDLAKFSNNQLITIFKTICEKNATRSLLHHYALVLQDEKDFDSSAELLQRALEESTDGDSFFSAESDQNILTSLGTLNSKLGQEALKKNLMTLAEKYFAIAEEYYNQAKYNNYSDGHAYHSHAFMYFIRGQRLKESGSDEYLKYFAIALEIISTAKDNLNEDNLFTIFELEERLYEAMGDENNLSRIIEILRDKFQSAKGYYIVSVMVFNDGLKLKAEGKIDDAKHKFKLADEKIKKGLRFFPNDEDCLVVKCKINKERFPLDYELQYNDLKLWSDVSSFPNVRLLYDFGRISFIMGYYDISRNIFEELQKGPGFKNKDRSRPTNPIMDSLNQPVQYEGRILNIYSLYDGNLQPYSLRDYKNKITFTPIACKFTPSNGNLVKFNISFNFRGPIAENLSKI
jgi:tetratricopeptide (TPR) repeat protein